MLIDARDLVVDGDGEVSADLVIVGAGAAGIAMANHLSSRGRTVLVLEAGGVPPSESHREYFTAENIGQPYDPVATRYRALGGATNRWAGWCRPLDRSEMRFRRWVGGLPWPLTHGELTRFSQQAAQLLNLGPWEWDIQAIADRAGLSTISDVPGADEQLASVVWRFATEPLSFAQRFNDFLQGPDVTVALHAPVTSMDIRKGRAHGVTIRLMDGTDRHINCQTLVLAAGGIENVRLLLEAKARHADSQMPIDESGWLGHGWQEHPHVGIGTAYIPDSIAEGPLWLYTGRRFIDGVPVLAGLTLPTRVRTERRMGALSITVDPQFGLNAPFAQGVQAVAASVAGEEVRPYVLFARSESRVVRSSRITLSKRRDPLGRQQARLNWRIAEGDFKDLRKASVSIARSFATLGLGVMRVDAQPADLAARVGGGAHHIGGARMSRDPGRGVTNEFGALHAIGNVFVTGSATFPSGGFSNPTLTIMALALRQADYIAQGRA